MSTVKMADFEEFQRVKAWIEQDGHWKVVAVPAAEPADTGLREALERLLASLTMSAKPRQMGQQGYEIRDAIAAARAALAAEPAGAPTNDLSMSVKLVGALAATPVREAAAMLDVERLARALRTVVDDYEDQLDSRPRVLAERPEWVAGWISAAYARDGREA